MFERFNKISSRLKHNSFAIWIVCAGEDIISKLGFEGLVEFSFFIFSESGQKRILVSSLEADNIPKEIFKEEEIVVYRKDFENVFVEALKQVGFDSESDKIGLNYENRFIRDSYLTLTSGQFLKIRDILHKHFFEEDTLHNVEKSIVSASSLLIDLFEEKTQDEIEKMRIAARRAEEIIYETFSRVKPGMSEKIVFDLLSKVMVETQEKFLKSHPHIVSEEKAWEEQFCPVVLTGKSFTKGGHTKPSDTVVEQGNTLYFDFGVKHEYDDGTNWCSDLQRMAYVVKDEDQDVPLEVQKRFDVIYDAISIGIKKIKPGVFGHEIDTVVRNKVKEWGSDYQHATGHPVGMEVHDLGTSLGPKTRNNSHKVIKLRGVYTIEPRIPVPNGCSVEEMVVVTEEGGVPLINRQKSLFLINNKKG